jgi:hypothetical protein
METNFERLLQLKTPWSLGLVVHILKTAVQEGYGCLQGYMGHIPIITIGKEKMIQTA